MPTIISSKMRSKQPAAPAKSAASEISSDEQLQLELAKQETAYAKAAAAKEKQLLKQEAAQQRQAAAKEKRQLKLEAAAAEQEARELARVQQEEEAAVAASVEVAFERDENAKQREQLLAAHKEREGAERERVKGEKAMETAFRKGVAEIDKQNSPPKPRMRGGPARMPSPTKSMQQRAASIKAQRCVEHGEYHCKDCASLRLGSQSKEFIKGARGTGGMFSGSADFEQSLESFHSEADLAAERGEGAKADAKEYLARLGEQEKASRGKGGCLRCGLPDCEDCEDERQMVEAMRLPPPRDTRNSALLREAREGASWAVDAADHNSLRLYAINKGRLLDSGSPAAGISASPISPTRHNQRY